MRAALALLALLLPSTAAAMRDLPPRPRALEKCASGNFSATPEAEHRNALQLPKGTEEDRPACTAIASGSVLFLQRDPNGYEDSVNLYAGMRWDPINLRDPTGRLTQAQYEEQLSFCIEVGRSPDECRASLSSRAGLVTFGPTGPGPNAVAPVGQRTRRGTPAEAGSPELRFQLRLQNYLETGREAPLRTPEGQFIEPTERERELIFASRLESFEATMAATLLAIEGPAAAYNLGRAILRLATRGGGPNRAALAAQQGARLTTEGVPQGGAAFGPAAEGRGGDVARAATTTEPRRIYSARELLRRAEEPGPYHNFPESFNAQIFQGARTVTPGYFRTPKPGLSNDSVMYTRPGSINGRTGAFEIGVRPSTSGRTEVIIHRFFRPD